MRDVTPFQGELPEPAAGAVEIVRTLADAGHQAVLAGGCVRDLLLGRNPQDYDVATDAPAERVCALFRATRQVGVQFGVILVKKRRHWVEVATFRSEGEYLDGRRPSSVTPTDARHDALRRDFTVNGMFLDPLRREILDYVGGQADLAARVIRAIGTPAARFAEDYLRLLRAVRFAARLDFALEPETLAAVQRHASRLVHVAAERVRDELERMLGHPRRAAAWQLLVATGLLPHLWSGAQWNAAHVRRVGEILPRLPADAPFTLATAVILSDRDGRAVEDVGRRLTFSNEQLQAVTWLVEHQADLDAPAKPTLAELKRLMARPEFEQLRNWALARHADRPDAARRSAELESRLAAIPPDRVQPSPLVRGNDLMARKVPPGPVYARILETLYTRQLAEELTTRAAALRALDELLAEEEHGRAT